MNDEKKVLVKYKREGHVGYITLDRPDRRNAMNTALWKDLDKAIGMAEEDEEARVVILRGEGKAFCAGIDLGPENELIAAIDSFGRSGYLHRCGIRPDDAEQPGS